MAQGGVNFTVTGFWGGVWVSFNSVSEQAAFDQSVIYILNPRPTGITCTECVLCKQAPN